MYIKRFFVCWLLLVLPVILFAQKGVWSDGPYIFKNEKGFRVVGSLRSEAKNMTTRLIDTLYTQLSGLGDFALCNEGGTFQFTIPGDFLNQDDVSVSKASILRDKIDEKMFVISDSHGDFHNFISILQAGGVINDAFGWTYGANRLVILGDTFDRGDDVLAIFWLIYSLEKQAERAAGAITYLWGNHDGMVLKGDLRYLTDKYKKLQDTLGVSYEHFFSKNTYLGNWLRKKEAIKIIGKTLFVHAGISPEFAASGTSLEIANKQISKYLDAPKKQYDKQTELLFGNDGPLWYRGLVSDQEKYNPISTKKLNKILKQYNVSRIIVGHTTFEGVKKHHDGKVISVDSKHKKSKISHLYQGVEIQKGKIKIITTRKRK